MSHIEDTQRLLQAAGSHYEATTPPIEGIIRAGRRAKARRRAAQVFGASAAVAVVAVSAFAIQNGVDPSDVANPADSLLVPSGTRLVGFEGVAVAVPDDWGTTSLDNLPCPGPTEDAVVFPSTSPLGAGLPCELQASTSSLHLLSIPDEDMSAIVEDAHAAGSLDGIDVFKTSLGPQVRCNGLPCSHPPPLFNQALIVPSKGVLMYVNSPQKSLIRDVLDSARLIPDGYTAVPDLSGVTADSEASDIAEAAGLVWVDRCPRGHVCDMGPVTATNPPAGSVVPVGTTVRVADQPEREKGNPAVWFLDRDQLPSPDSTTVIVLVEELGCTSGQGAAGNMLPPIVSSNDDEVRIQVETRPREGGYTCPGHPLAPLTVQLGEPLGDRLLVDANTAADSGLNLGLGPDVVVPPYDPRASDDLSGEVPTESELIGAWQAVELDGEPVPADSTVAQYRLDFALNVRLVWSGADECNATSGRFNLRSDGTVSTTGVTTLIECGPRWDDDHPNAADVVRAVAQVRLDEGRLRFYDEDDRPVGVFERAI